MNAGSPNLIMFARHGEKPGDSGAPHGVNHHGEHDPHGLSVRGWMRAGALGALLSHAPTAAHGPVSTPQRIIATKPSPQAKSKRERDTADPIARKLSLPLESTLEHGQEEDLFHSLVDDPRPSFVVWHHGTLADLVRMFPLTNAEVVPHSWPDDRFDLLWVLTRDHDQDAYTFASVNQNLLDGDLV